VVKRVSLEIKNRKRFKYRIEHKTMPSKAIGMGVCPRCGKPGTIVIKAGNYVYIKHGNTWHYIGTIDKVNLNKILIKNPENITTNKPKQKINYITISLMVIAIMTATLGIIILFNSQHNNIIIQGNNNLNKDRMINLLVHCNYTITNTNNAVIISCNNTAYNITTINLGNFTFLTYNIHYSEYYNSTIFK